MLNAKITLIDIANKVPYTYNTNEGWVVKKMRSEYANRIVAILPIIYKKDKVQYFCNKFAVIFPKQIMEILSIGLKLCIINWSRN
jgi:hypothetical protein